MDNTRKAFDFLSIKNVFVHVHSAGVWEVMIGDYHDLTGEKLPCVVPSACRNVTTKRDSFDLFFNS